MISLTDINLFSTKHTIHYQDKVGELTVCFDTVSFTGDADKASDYLLNVLVDKYKAQKKEPTLNHYVVFDHHNVAVAKFILENSILTYTGKFDKTVEKLFELTLEKFNLYKKEYNAKR